MIFFQKGSLCFLSSISINVYGHQVPILQAGSVCREAATLTDVIENIPTGISYNSGKAEVVTNTGLTVRYYFFYRLVVA